MYMTENLKDGATLLRSPDLVSHVGHHFTAGTAISAPSFQRFRDFSLTISACGRIVASGLNLESELERAPFSHEFHTKCPSQVPEIPLFPGFSHAPHAKSLAVHNAIFPHLCAFGARGHDERSIARKTPVF